MIKVQFTATVFNPDTEETFNGWVDPQWNRFELRSEPTDVKVYEFETLAEATGRKDSVILKGNRRWFAPGHNSIITDAAGRDWIAYHAIDARRPYQTTGDGGRWVRRVMLLDRVVYRDGWPRIEDGTPSHRKRVAPVVRASSRRRPRP